MHINEPDFFSTVYSSGKSRVNKDSSTEAAFGHPGARVATVDHDQHGIRRGYLNHHYSKRAVDALIPLINERIDVFCARLNGTLKTGSHISLNKAFSAFTANVIYAQLFGAIPDYLSDPDLSVPLRDAFIGLLAGFHISRFTPNLLHMLKELSPSLFKLISRLLSGPLMTVLFDLQEQTRETMSKPSSTTTVPTVPQPIVSSSRR